MTSYKLIKMGKLCQLTFRINDITTTENWSIIAELPQDCIPKQTVRFPCCDAGKNDVYLCAVSPQGLQIMSTVSGLSIWGQVIYLTS